MVNPGYDSPCFFYWIIIRFLSDTFGDGNNHMRNRKIIISLCIAGALFAAFSGYWFFAKQRQAVSINIISKDSKITLKDMKEYFSNNQFMSGTEDPNKYFSQTIANPNTVKFFKYLQMNIKAGNLDDHLKEVEKYLHSIMEQAKADEMFTLYKKFCNYEIELADKVQKWPHPRNPDELIRYLKDIHEYRRETFGSEIADAMWGIEVKGQEYNIRKGAIVHDANLYGIEKEKKLSLLKDEMWGTDPENAEEPPKTDPEKYTSYQEKQAIYQKDLQELPAEQRLEKIKEFRKEYFAPDQLARLEQVDAELEADRKREADYYSQEKAIMNNPGMTDAQKEEALRELQDNTFGDQAEAFRRRMNIQKNTNIKSLIHNSER